MKALSAKFKYSLISVVGNFVFIVYCLALRYNTSPASLMSSFGPAIGLFAGGLFVLFQVKASREVLRMISSSISKIIHSIVYAILTTLPVYVFIVCPPEPEDCQNMVTVDPSKALWIAPLMTIAFLFSTWIWLQPTFSSTKKVKEMSPSDFHQVKTTMEIAHVDPEKAIPLVSDETVNMSPAEWHMLSQDLKLAGIDIEKKRK